MKKTISILLLTACAAYASAGCDEARRLMDAGDARGALAALGGARCPALEAVIYTAAGQLDKAETAAGEAVQADPADYASRLALARLKSWRNELKGSAEDYRGAIALKPGSTEAQLELARVLAWDKKDAASGEAYDKAFAASGFEWIKEEKLGKAAMRSARPQDGLKHLQKAVELNPSDAEALFDIAQFYSNCGLYRQAEPWYARLAAASPYNSAAAAARAKNAAYARGTVARAGLTLWNADGADRMTDVKYLNAYLSGERELAQDLVLRLTGAHGHYSFAGAPSIDENSGGAYLGYTASWRTGAGLSFASRAENRPPASRENFGAFVWHKPLQNLTGTLSFNRDPLINNAGAFARGLREDYYRARLAWDITGRLSAAADYRGGSLNDSNTSRIYGAEAAYTFSREPQRLFARVRYERQRYRRASALYFAPAGYDLYSLNAGYRGYFGPDGLYYGAREDYFELGCRASFDNTPYLSVGPSAALNLGLRPGWTLRAEYSLTGSHYYRDNYYGLSAVKEF